MNNEICNYVELSGILKEELEFSHEVFGELFYKGKLYVKRKSGVYDIIIVTISQYIIPDEYLNKKYNITGEFRSYNDENRHVKLSVLVKDIKETEENSINNIYIKGYICKNPIYRTTPKGRMICDIYVAVNRLYNKSDYLPCICWGRNATKMSKINIGTQVTINGRIQSREYIKDNIIHTAYEISVMNII